MLRLLYAVLGKNLFDFLLEDGATGQKVFAVLLAVINRLNGQAITSHSWLWVNIYKLEYVGWFSYI